MATSIEENAGPLVTLSNQLADAVESAGGAIVAVNARQHVSASGVHWRPGVVVATDHTIDREEGITVTLADGQSVPATLAGRDPGTDLAILKVENISAAVAEISEEPLKIGHIVVAVARPGSTGLGASLGAVSALSGSWRTWSGGHIDQFIRPDLTLYPGFSGGPLVDVRGRIVGINTSGLTRGMGLTIPVSTINRVVEQLLSRGRIARGYLGLGLQPVRLPDSLISSLNLAGNEGLMVVSVDGGGPADKAGVFIGDILVALDGKAVRSSEDVQAMLDPERVGTQIDVQAVRGGARTDLKLAVGERPSRG